VLIFYSFSCPRVFGCEVAESLAGFYTTSSFDARTAPRRAVEVYAYSLPCRKE
jgi:hypothetical protein